MLNVAVRVLALMRARRWWARERSPRRERPELRDGPVPSELIWRSRWRATRTC
jgi:hypothetical protein